MTTEHKTDDTNACHLAGAFDHADQMSGACFLTMSIGSHGAASPPTS
jgi:hypothetical protein